MTLLRPTGPAGRHHTDGTRSRVLRVLTPALAVAIALTGCGDAEQPENNPPGTNVRVNDISVRYAHLEDPDAPGTGHRVGDDIALYLWFVNESSEPAALTEVSSPIATEVTMTSGQTPVDLPLGALVELGPDDPHFVLEDITTQVRGSEFVPVNLTFSDGSRVEIMVQPLDIDLKGPVEPGV